MTTPVDLDKLDALESLATKGPWEQTSRGGIRSQHGAVGTPTDEEFIAALRNAWPDVSRELHEARATVERMAVPVQWLDAPTGEGWWYCATTHQTTVARISVAYPADDDGPTHYRVEWHGSECDDYTSDLTNIDGHDAGRQWLRAPSPPTPATGAGGV